MNNMNRKLATKKQKRIRLHRETVRSLSEGNLDRVVAAGSGSFDRFCLCSGGCDTGLY
jgi:hypothetical protein